MERKTVLIFVLLLFTVQIIPITSLVSSSSEGHWTIKTPLSTARSQLEAATVNGKIYALGGYPNFNTNEEYNPSTDTWTTKTAMPTPRFSFAAAVYQNKIYCFGGFVANMSGGYVQPSVTGVIEVYDPSTDKWETKKPMPTPRAQLAANVIGDKIFLTGGRTGGQQSTVALNQVYDPLNESWTTKASMGYPVVQFASAAINNKIYAIGGQDEFNNPINLDTVQIYDSLTDNWTLGSSIPTPVWLSAACAIQYSGTSRIYLIGGQPINTGGSTNAVQIYHPENDNWTTGDSMPTSRFDLAVATTENAIFAIGGVDHYIFPNEPARAENEEYTLANTQTQPPSSPTSTIVTSPAQTATQNPTSSIESPTPTPTIPELQSWSVATLVGLIIVLSIAVWKKLRRQR